MNDPNFEVKFIIIITMTYDNESKMANILGNCSKQVWQFLWLAIKLVYL